MFCRSLEEQLEAIDYGEKAYNLSQLIDYGVTVPMGFAISKKAYQVYKNENHFPANVLSEINTLLSAIKAEKVIVRSSAIGEDSKHHSFAGQLDSFVTENNAESVVEAVLKCWMGLENDRLKAYMDMANVQIVDMGVIIQTFIEPDIAGVTFTSSPNTPEEMYTEYVAGRGEQLVSGEITPHVFNHKNTNKDDLNLTFDVNELERNCGNLKKQYGYDLDIEWVVKNGQLYFVQARPITVQKQKVYWTNTNLNENYPDPISPLLYSIARDSYYHYFKNLAGLLQIDAASIRSLEYDFSNTVGIWGNRIYYNMTSIHNILSSSPLKSYFIDAFNKFVGYEDRDVSTEDRSKATSIMRLGWSLVRLNFKMEGYVKEIEKMVGDYSTQALKGVEEKTLFYEFLDLRFNQWYRASVADFFAMIHYKLLSKITQRFYGKEAVGIHNKLVQAIPHLISTEPLNDIYDIAKAIKELPNGQTDFLSTSPEKTLDEVVGNPKWKHVGHLIDNYLDKWGFRCSGELMFLSSNYVEEPSKLISLIQGYLKQDAVDPREVVKLKAAERRQALRSFIWRIIRKRHLLIPISIVEITALLLISRLCKKAIAARERVRYRQAEMYFRFKQAVKRIGGEDFFFLSYKEIGEQIASSIMFPIVGNEVIKKRRVVFKANSKPFPEHFSTDFGERPNEIVEKIKLDPNAKTFTGLAASSGQIRARVVVLSSVLEGNRIRKGDILVTQQTDPGWAMVFPLISGLIVERGGALSHGAIVAREFGIPAVVGVKGISEVLKDGDEVILDGDLGKIQLL